MHRGPYCIYVCEILLSANEAARLLQNNKESFFKNIIELYPGYNLKFFVKSWKLQTEQFYDLKFNDKTEVVEANKEAEKHIVLVHGFSVPSYIWEPTYQEAIQRGYGVIRYDTFGRGFSDNPDLDYSTEFFAKQLINLLDALALKKVHLVGLSDGGRTVAYIAAHFPDRIDQLIFVAPAGFHTDEAIKENTVTPQEIENFINEAYQNIGQGQLSDFYAPERFTEWATRYNGLLKYQGFARAMLSTRKNYQAMNPLHQTLFENKTKTEIHDFSILMRNISKAIVHAP